MEEYFPDRIKFYLEERINVFSKDGKEWALNVIFDLNQKWTIATWEKEPSKSEVDFITKAALRSFEIAYYQIRIPKFQPGHIYCNWKKNEK